MVPKHIMRLFQDVDNMSVGQLYVFHPFMSVFLTFIIVFMIIILIEEFNKNNISL